MSNDLVNEDYDAIGRLVAWLATDVWDEHPISHHVRQACTTASGGMSESQVERVMLALANLHGYEATDRSFATDEYLDSVGWSHGWTHLRFIESLRTWLQDNHPQAGEHTYAAARRRAVRR